MKEILKFDEIQNYRHISFGVEKANEKLEKIASGELFPLLTSIESERRVIGGYYPSDQIILAGRTGSGKSSKILHDIYDYVDWTINPKWKDKIVILYDSLEMPDWRNVLRLVSRHSSTSVKKILTELAINLEDEERNKLKFIYEKFKNKPIYFSNYYPNVFAWETQKVQAQKQFPDKTIINILDHTRLITTGNEKSEEQKITALMNAGMRLKNNFDMINIFLTQMNRNIETSGNRKELGQALPISSDIFGADSVQQTADIVIAYHRPGFYGLTEFELPDGSKISTGLGKDSNGNKTNDNLFIEVILKAREGDQGKLMIKHDLENNKFMNLR